MGEKQTPRVQLEDIDHLRTKSTPELRSLQRREQRSVDELTAYLKCIRTVLNEREGEAGGAIVETGYDMGGGSCAEAAATFPQYTKGRPDA